MKSTPYLRLSKVVKSYDGLTNAVNDVSLDIARGEFVTFLGPSGSGKTTTLMMIAGFERPTRGSILLDGKDLTRTKPYERNIGVVFQNYALFPHMNAARNVAFPLRMRGFPREQVKRRVDKALELVGLERFREAYPRELSGGQQQRIALARGLVFDPDVLLLDEPLGALDKNLREQMQVEIKRIHRDVGITMVYVTHDQTEAMTMSDRVAVFRGGKLEQLAPPLEVYNHPATRFVGEFIGDSNFLDAHPDPSRCGWANIDGFGAARLPHAATELANCEHVHLLVRPERLRLLDDRPTQGMNAADLYVEAVVNYGDSLLVIGKVGRVPLRVRASGIHAELIREGTRVTVGWKPDDAYAIPASAGSN